MIFCDPTGSTGPLVGYGTFFFGGEFVVVHLRQKNCRIDIGM